MADPRAGDVAQAERLLEQATRDGIVALPVLSAAEVWVLCGDEQVLADEAEVRWWASKSADELEKYRTAMVDLLIDRGLIRRAADPASSRLPMTPELAVIVAARQLPAVVAIGTLESGPADKAPRLYGLAEADQAPRVLVSEVVLPARQPAFGPLHHFSLVSRERAGRILAMWAAAQDKPGFLARKARSGRRIVDVYRNRPGAELTRDRVLVSRAADALEVTRQRPGAALEPDRRCDTDELASLVTAMLAEPAR